MSAEPLSNRQVDEFVERGWTVLRGAFSQEVAQAVRRSLGSQIGIDLELPEQWNEPRVWLQEMMTDDWHVEGGWFRHHISSGEQALLNLFCFSTVEPGGGGTLLVEGSHHLAARLLWDAEPDGLEVDDFDAPLTAVLDEQGWPGVVEVVAEEGDVVLAHPLLFHASNPNHGKRPRVMAQPPFSMTEPMRTEGGGLFPVEVPLARARPLNARS